MQYIYTARISSLYRKLWSDSQRFFKVIGFFPNFIMAETTTAILFKQCGETQMTKNFVNDNKEKATARIITGKISVHILRESFLAGVTERRRKGDQPSKGR